MPKGDPYRRPLLSSTILFVLPAFVIVCLFILVPIGMSLWQSFFSDRTSGNFVGWNHYRYLFSDPVFWMALANTLFLAAGSLLLQMPFALGLAWLLTRNIRGRGLLRTSFFLPVLMPTSAVALVWLFMVQPPNDVINRLLETVGLTGLQQSWLDGTRWTAMTTILVVVSWKYIGFHMMLYVAGLESIPEEIYEAAHIDGAGSWRQFLHITLPLLKRVIFISFTLSLIGSLKYFDIVWVMTDGNGPFSHATDLMATYMFRTGFGLFPQPNLASAAAIVILVICVLAFIGTSLIRRATRR